MTHPITIVPLGPGDPSLLTLGSLRALKEGSCVILRTARHGAVPFLGEEGVRFTSLDELYDQYEDFDALNDAIAARILAEAGRHPVCYAVMDPASDASVTALIRAGGDQLKVHCLPGVSAADACAAAVLPCASLSDGLRSLPARAAAEAAPDPSLPLVITEVDTAALAGDVKLWLGDVYPEEMTVYLLRPSEKAERRVTPLPLTELDRQKRYDHTCCVFIPAVDMMARSRFVLGDLERILRILCAPDGCPWDREQTHETLRKYLIEEAYEAAWAMGLDDPDQLADELGDVLLQVVFHAEVGRKHGEFTMADVISHICAKMIYRHAHIFGDRRCDTAEEVSASWEELKKREKGEKTQGEVLADVCRGLPALMRAQKVQKKAAQVGFDWDSAPEALPKVHEEAGEVKAELDAGRDPGEELGDLLFACVNVARLAGQDAEDLLARATDKFTQRFTAMEAAILADGKKLQGLTINEFDVYWDAVKRREHGA